MRRLLPLLAVPLILAACGSGNHAEIRTKTPACTPPRNPPAMGEAIREQLCLKGKLGLMLPTAHPGLCYDISRYQGDIDLDGLRCVIIQTNDGTGRSNPYFGAQVLAARRARIPWGTYTFLDGESGAAQASVALEVARGWGRTLGVWADAEVPGVYGQTCGFIDRAREGSQIVGVYSAPGLYEGGRCQGFLWPAEWSSSAPYPFGGYPASAIKLWQWCGTCAVDRDQPRNGFLRPPPKPRCRPCERAHLRALERESARLWATFNVKRCEARIRRHRRLGPKCEAWGRRLRAVNNEIRALRHRLG